MQQARVVGINPNYGLAPGNANYGVAPVGRNQSRPSQPTESCFSGFCVTIQPDEIATLEVMGKFQKILDPGLNFIIPCLSRVRRLTARLVENKVRVSTKTKDNVFVTVNVSVQQQVHRPNAKEAMYRLQNPDRQVDAYVQDVVRGHCPDMELDALFEAKDTIAKQVKDRLQAALQGYGFEIVQVLVVDIEPDEKVKNAMNQINSARRMRQAAQEQAEADKLTVIKKAEGEKAHVIMQAEAEAESKFLQAEGIAKSRAAIVKGLKETVGAGGQPLTAAAVQELLLVTTYMDTLEKMGKSNSKVIFTPLSTEGGKK